MPIFFLNYFLTPAAGILLAAVTVMSGGSSAVAANPGAGSIVPQSEAENVLLAQVTVPRRTNNPSNQPARNVNRVPLPVKIPEPSMIVGLGLVASSLVVSRRRRLKN